MIKKVNAEIKDILKIFRDRKRNFIFGFIIFAIFILFCAIKFDFFNKNSAYCNFIATIIQGFIAGGITYWAMKVIDNENKNRWEKDYYQKKKSETTLDFLITLDYCLGYTKDSLNEFKVRNNIRNFTAHYFSCLKKIFPLAELMQLFYENSDVISDIENIISFTRILLYILASNNVNDRSLDTNNECFKISKDKILEDYKMYQINYLLILKKQDIVDQMLIKENSEFLNEFSEKIESYYVSGKHLLEKFKRRINE